MNNYDVKRLALVLAVQAEIEGYKSANESRKQIGDSMAYNEDQFFEKALELQNLAYAHDDQL